MAEPFFIGIDLGTARVKVGIFDRRGVQHALRIVPHDDGMGGITQDPGEWWRSVCRALRTLSAGIDSSRVAAIAVCGQGPTLVTTDARLHPCGPALTWMDKRASAEAAELRQAVGRPVEPGHYVAKALRLQRVDPQPRRRWYFQSWDYIAARLCGVPHTSSTWFTDEIAASGLPAERFPPYVAPGSHAGTLSVAAARSCGLRPGIPIVAGTNDGIASCIGSGLTEKGRSVILGGTSGGFVLCWEPVAGAWEPPPGAYPEPPGLRYLGATISSSGLVLDWLASLFHVHDYAAWLECAAAVPPGADGLLLLPYISGVFLPYTADERAPIDDPAARGVFIGLQASHTSAHLVRAVLEGVAYAVRQVHDVTVAQGGVTAATRTVGGQAHSRLWNQIKADVLGLPVLVPAEVEAGALGAACIAAAGSGYFETLWAASDAMVQVQRQLDPDPAAHERYNRLYDNVYTPLYARVKDLFPHLRA